MKQLGLIGLFLWTIYAFWNFIADTPNRPVWFCAMVLVSILTRLEFDRK